MILVSGVAHSGYTLYNLGRDRHDKSSTHLSLYKVIILLPIVPVLCCNTPVTYSFYLAVCTWCHLLSLPTFPLLRDCCFPVLVSVSGSHSLPCPSPWPKVPLLWKQRNLSAGKSPALVGTPGGVSPEEVVPLVLLTLTSSLPQVKRTWNFLPYFLPKFTCFLFKFTLNSPPPAHRYFSNVSLLQDLSSWLWSCCSSHCMLCLQGASVEIGRDELPDFQGGLNYCPQPNRGMLYLPIATHTSRTGRQKWDYFDASNQEKLGGEARV